MKLSPVTLIQTMEIKIVEDWKIFKREGYFYSSN